MRPRRHKFIGVLSSVAAAWPLAVHAQTAQEKPSTPKIEMVRVKNVDPAVPKDPFLLSGDIVDLMKEFSLGVCMALVVPGHPPISCPSTCAMANGDSTAYGGLKLSWHRTSAAASCCSQPPDRTSGSVRGWQAALSLVIPSKLTVSLLK